MGILFAVTGLRAQILVAVARVAVTSTQDFFGRTHDATFADLPCKSKILGLALVDVVLRTEGGRVEGTTHGRSN